MRLFRDETGRVWDVVVGRESWGANLALFVPRNDPDPGGETPPIRQAPLEAAGYDEAAGELDGMSEEALRDLLARSAPRTHD